MSNNLNGKMQLTPRNLDAMGLPAPNEGEVAKQITTLVNAAGTTIEQTVRDIREDARPAQANAKKHLGAAIAANVTTIALGAAFAVAGGPLGIAAAVTLIGGGLLYGATVVGPASRG